jgi:branched-chain amino acid transport system substrate-binding protein
MNTKFIIGNVGTTSGPLGKRYGVMQQAVQVWADVVNKHGGIAGHPVRVEAGDDANDPARHLSLVQQMVEQQHVAGARRSGPLPRPPKAFWNCSIGCKL